MSEGTRKFRDLGLALKGPRPPVACHRCGRVGRVRFTLVDRFADGSEQWRCISEHACMDRARRKAMP